MLGRSLGLWRLAWVSALGAAIALSAVAEGPRVLLVLLPGRGKRRPGVPCWGRRLARRGARQPQAVQEAWARRRPSLRRRPAVKVLGYDNVPPYLCYLRGQVGAECDYSSPDHGTASCAEGLNCICAQPPCDLGTCQQPSIATGAAGCGRSTAFGRESGDCTTGECLCLNVECATPVCAQPRNFGESCDGSTQICRQGLTCHAGLCADATDRNLDALACPAKAL